MVTSSRNFKCKRCGVSVTLAQGEPLRKYCTPACYPSNQPRPVHQNGVCAFCGNGYLRTTNSTRKFCSDQCRLDSLSTRRHGLIGDDALARVRLVGTRRPCATCGRLFLIKRTAMTQMYCSRACVGTANKFKQYGITIQDYNRMFAEQSGHCKMCGGSPLEGQSLHVDHDHTTGTVRGLLCVSCNVHLGWFELNEQKIHEYRHGGKTA